MCVGVFVICFSIDEIDVELDEEEISDEDEESEPVPGVRGM